MRSDTPSKEILEAFGISETPIKLQGGQGTSFKAGGVVLKPIENEEETNCLAELTSKIIEKGFRIARPIKAMNGEWVYKGWKANKFVKGREVKKRWEQKLSVSRKFHNSLIGIPKPAFLDKIDNPWAIADKMVWGGLPMKYGEKLKPLMLRLERLIKPINPINQIIHGDMTGNILFYPFVSPAIIDLSLYWHPAKYAEAIIVVDSIVWYSAPDSLINKLDDTSDNNTSNNVFEINQLLIRATMWRIKTKEEYIAKYGKNGDDLEIEPYRHLIELIEKRVS